MCPPVRRGDKELVVMEGEFSGAVKQHKSATALDYCFPSAQLGVPSWSGGPHTGRGHRTQIPTLNNLYTEDSLFLPLTHSSSFLPRLLVTVELLPRAAATPVTAHGLFLLHNTVVFKLTVEQSYIKAILLMWVPDLGLSAISLVVMKQHSTSRSVWNITVIYLLIAISYFHLIPQLPPHPSITDIGSRFVLCACKLYSKILQVAAWRSVSQHSAGMLHYKQNGIFSDWIRHFICSQDKTAAGTLSVVHK